MARLNVHVQDDLIARARTAGLNVSALTQTAIAAKLERRGTDAWLADLPIRERTIPHEMPWMRWMPLEPNSTTARVADTSGTAVSETVVVDASVLVDLLAGTERGNSRGPTSTPLSHGLRASRWPVIC